MTVLTLYLFGRAVFAITLGRPEVVEEPPPAYGETGTGLTPYVDADARGHRLGFTAPSVEPCEFE